MGSGTGGRTPLGFPLRRDGTLVEGERLGVAATALPLTPFRFLEGAELPEANERLLDFLLLDGV